VTVAGSADVSTLEEEGTAVEDMTVSQTE